MQNSKLGYIYVLLAGAIWGGIGVFVMELSKLGVDAAGISFWRVFFAFLLSLGITVAKLGSSSMVVTGRTLFYSALLGIVCHGIYNIFYSYAVAMTGVSISAVLLNIAPAVTLFIAAILFSEKITANKLLAVVVNVIGCVLTVTGGNLSTEGFSVVGVLFGVGAGICYALTAIFGRYASEGTNTFTVSTYSYLFATLSLVFYTDIGKELSQMTWPILLWAVGFALIPTTLAYFLYYAGVQRLSDTSMVPVLASLETVVAALFGILLYHEALGMMNIFGIALVMLSIVLMNHKSNVASAK